MDRYALVAPIYDLCTAVLTGGAIWRSRVCQLEVLEPGQHVLFAGGGTGRAAVEAARRGLRVTLVDRSPAMLARARRRAARAGVTVTCIEADLATWFPPSPWTPSARTTCSTCSTRARCCASANAWCSTSNKAVGCSWPTSAHRKAPPGIACCSGCTTGSRSTAVRF
ncbi:MAG: methyltransferase domain-containing protein [Planctomycetota bacterium]